MVNEGQTLLNIRGLFSLGVLPSEPFTSFSVLMSIKHPKFFAMDAVLAKHPMLYEQYRTLQSDDEIIADVLRATLRNSGHLFAE